MASHYKDSLFRSLFSDEKTLRKLYNALTGANLDEDDRIVINTLDETLFTANKNDVSFSTPSCSVIIIDHQATVNENMPFRFLEPVFRLLENSITDKKAIYQTKRIPLPYPEFYVLENSTSPAPDYREMR